MRKLSDLPKGYKGGTKSDSRTEQLSAIVHDAWVSWTKQIQRRVKPVWRECWRDLRVPYDELTGEEKDKDRIWGARL